MPKEQRNKLVFFLPNSFTALNIACGFIAILLAIQGRFYQASMLVLLGAIFDSVDGRVARLVNAQSSFGEQFDSLSDLISFGITPALIFHNRFLLESGRLGMIVAFLYVLSGALRLARFNANVNKVNPNFFQGLPIPSGAMGVIGYVLLSTWVPALVNVPYLAEVYILVYAALMISNIPFPSFKKSEWVRRKKKTVLFIIFFVLMTVFIEENVMILFWLTAYVLGSLLYYLTHRGQLSDVFNWDDEEEEDVAVAQEGSSH